MKKIIVDIWADGARAALSPRRGELSVQDHFDRVDNLGVDAVSIFCSRPDRKAPQGIKWLWRDLEALRRLVEMHRDAGRRVTTTDWVGASKAEVALHLGRLRRLCEAGVWPDRIEHDAEEDVVNDSAAEASRAPKLLEEGYAALESEFSRPMPTVVITAIPGAPGDVRRYATWERAKIWRGQWYSFYRPKNMGKHWSHRAKRPGPMQDWGASVARELVEDGIFETFEAGLAWYWQHQTPGYDGDIESPLYDAVREAVRHTNEICGWSLKNLVKPGREARVVTKFVQQLTAGLLDLGPEEDQGHPGENHMVEKIQWHLKIIGHDLGKFGPDHNGIDGRWGGLTSKAAALAEESLDLHVDGRPDLELLRALTQSFHQSFGKTPNYMEVFP